MEFKLLLFDQYLKIFGGKIMKTFEQMTSEAAENSKESPLFKL